MALSIERYSQHGGTKVVKTGPDAAKRDIKQDLKGPQTIILKPVALELPRGRNFPNQEPGEQL